MCVKCKLAGPEVQVVKGEGPLNAKIMLVGEAPGREENEAGRPFVGAAGRALDRHLERIGLKREDVYITNVVKCRPPANRTPTRDEMLKCMEHLHREIVSVRPKVVVAMGRISVQALSGQTGSMNKLHGRVSDVTMAVKDDKNSAPHEFKLMLTSHPAAELYNAGWKDLMNEDFEKLKKLVEEKKIVELPSEEELQKKELTVKKVTLDTSPSQSVHKDDTAPRKMESD